MDIQGYNASFIEMVNGISPKIRDLKKILIKGANIDYQITDNGMTALMLAVERQYDRVAAYLLQQGANPLLKNYDKQIASELINPKNTIYQRLKDFELLFAVLNNDVKSVERIIAAGALINFKGSDGFNALMIAVKQDFEEMIEYLLSQGADPAVNHQNGHTLFDLTSNNNVHVLLEEALDWQKETESTPKKKFGFFRNAVNSSLTSN